MSWLCLLFISMWNAWETRSLRLEERQRDLQHVSEAVLSLVKEFGQLSREGKMSEGEARTQAMARVKSMRYGKDGYFSITHSNSVMVMYPLKSDMDGKDMSDVKDPNGTYLFKEISRAGKSGGGFIDYMWPKPGADRPQPKKSYVAYYQPWDWCLVTGAYMDDVDHEFLLSLEESVGLLLAVGLLMTVVVAALTRSLQAQLGGEPHYAAEVASRIATGNLTTQVKTRSGDQKSMLFAMARMQQELTATISGIKQSAELIANAAEEIAAGNTDLSQRTEAQASSLEETASSMEQLTGSVRQNADNARQATELAASASNIASKGGDVVGRVVRTMAGIDESSRKIADITGIIEGIAFQTNILALNAAVEAARAGEQGRGFAVVAGEVRILAQRSAGAAKEIKELIGDSVSRVQAGSALVQEAGAVMEEILASVKHVTDIMSEISAASEEQSSGIAQVNQAVSQMDEATQQNAALVEQAAAAALSLDEQARALRTVTAKFSV